jgi:hypothetical protein
MEVVVVLATEVEGVEGEDSCLSEDVMNDEGIGQCSLMSFGDLG